MFCSLQYRSIWNLCFTIDILYFAYQGGQEVSYVRDDPRPAFITKDARTETVDAPLTLR